jgi:hypothetical protein
LQANSDVGKANLEFCQNPRQHARCGDGKRAQRHGSGIGAVDPVERLVQSPQFRQHATRGADQHHAGFCHAHAARMAIEHAGLQNVFQFLQVSRQRRLADAQSRGRFQQTALLFDDVHGPQQVQPQPLIKEASLVHRRATF